MIGRRALLVEGHNTYFGTGPTTPHTINIYNNERRKVTVKDIELHTRITDYLPNMDFVFSPGSISDVDKDRSDIYEFAATVKNTTRLIPFITWNRDNLEKILQMGSCLDPTGKI